MAKEASLYGKPGLFVWQKRPLDMANGSIYMTNEAYLYGKRGLFIWQMMPLYMANKAYFIWQMRPIYMANEGPIYTENEAY